MIALFFDTETTGFKHGDFMPEIVQIGAILQNTDTKRVLAEINLICNPENPIPQEVSEIHGITDEVAKAYGVPQEAAESLFGLLAMQADEVVAHNIQFDMGILRDRWTMVHAVLAPKTQFCTMRNLSGFADIPRKHAGRNEYTKLAHAYKYFFGSDFENAHDAMADVRACRDVYFKIREMVES